MFEDGRGRTERDVAAARCLQREGFRAKDKALGRGVWGLGRRV